MINSEATPHKLSSESSGLMSEFDKNSDERKTLIQQYISDFQSGNSSAYEHLIKLSESELKTTVNSVCYKRNVLEADKEDLYQNLLIRIHSGLSSFKEGHNFFAWAYSITNNLCTDDIRKKNTRGQFNQLSLDALSSDDSGWLENLFQDSYSDEIGVQNLGSMGQDPQDIYECLESLEWAVQNVSPRMRETFRLSIIEGMTRSEVGKVVGIPEATAKSRLVLATKRLHEVAGGKLHQDTIIEAAQEVFDITFKWPSCHDFEKIKTGPLKGETWGAIDKLLRVGGRGLSGGSSISKLLFKHGLGNNITEQDVLDEAWNVKRTTGKRPSSSDRRTIKTGKLKGKSWFRMNHALERGDYNLPGGTTLAQFLDANGCVDDNNLNPVDIIVAAKLHKKNTGRWPSSKDNNVIESGPLKGENWLAIHTALRDGYRGLEANGKGLPKFLRDNDCYDRKPNAVDVIFSVKFYEQENAGKQPNNKTKERINDGSILNGMSWAAVDKRKIGGFTLFQHISNINEAQQQEQKLEVRINYSVSKEKSLVPL